MGLLSNSGRLTSMVRRQNRESALTESLIFSMKSLRLSIDFKTVTFLNKETEQQYRSDVAMRNRKKIREGVVWIGFAFLLYGVYSVETVNPAVGICGYVFLAGLMVALRKIANTPWFGKENNAENSVAMVVMIICTWFAFGTNREAYSHDLDCQHWNLLQDKDGASSMTSHLQNFGLFFGFWPAAVVLMIFHAQVVHYRVFKTLVMFMMSIHALRTLYIHPVSDKVGWAVSSYSFLPILILHIGKHDEIRKREVFIAHQTLEANNIELAAKLDAAEKALAHEQPTEQEHQVVASVFGRSGAKEELRQFAINFEELEFHERVGAGAFAEVIRATYNSTVCVVKRLLRARIDEENAGLMLTEIRLLSKLRHPNIVQFLGASWDSVANICILFEYLPSGSLGDVLNDTSLTLTWQDPKLRMATDVAQGLSYLHNLSPPILHRDVKPDNVLVTATFTCKLTDFGASREFDRSSTAQAMTVVGTTVYMAPEVAHGYDYATPVDVYSYGFTLWQMHTGKIPFSDLPKMSRTHLLKKTCVDGLRPALGDDFPKALADLIRKCWSAKPSDRPTMPELLAELRSETILLSSSINTPFQAAPKLRVPQGKELLIGGEGGEDTFVLATSRTSAVVVEAEGFSTTPVVEE